MITVLDGRKRVIFFHSFMRQIVYIYQVLQTSDYSHISSLLHLVAGGAGCVEVGSPSC